MNNTARDSRRVIGYTSCPECNCWSLGVQGNGRIVRHSISFGSVEKVGPGTRHPNWRTTICKGSGKKVSEEELKLLLELKSERSCE